MTLYSAKKGILKDATGNIIIPVVEKELPNIQEKNGKFLTNNGTTVKWEDIPSFLNIFDIVKKDHILSYKETNGLALLGSYVYKEPSSGSRYGYPDFYAQCLKEFSESKLVPYLYNASKHGEPDYSNGIISKFSSSNYFRFPERFMPKDKIWEQVYKITTGNDVNLRQHAICIGSNSAANGDIGCWFTVFQNKFQWGINLTSTDSNSQLGKYTVLPNTTYWIRMSFDKKQYKYEYSLDGIEWIEDYVYINATPLPDETSNGYLGIGWSGDAIFQGSIDLVSCYWKIENNITWKGTLDVYKHKNEHYFYEIENRNIIDTIINETGNTWFYGIDKKNERVLLPTKPPMISNIKTDRVLIENYQNGTTWYNLYSDGLLEQGGFAGNYNVNSASGYVTFIKPYLNTLYDIVASEYAHWRDSNWLAIPESPGKTPNGFTWGQGYHGTSAYWRTRGFVDKPKINDVQFFNTEEKLYMVVGNINATNRSVVNAKDVTSSNNDTVPLFTPKVFGFKPNNPSWLQAGKQCNNSSIYSFAYESLVKAINNENPYNLKVININAIDTVENSNIYWKINQEEQYFITPIETENRILIDKKIPTPEDVTWYNLYSDGWCEQGGAGSYGNGARDISLPKIFKDNTYSLVVTCRQNNLYGTGYILTPSKIRIETRGHDFTVQNCNCTWQVQGYVQLKAEDYKLNSLYFKIANAIENIEVLDASKILDVVNDINIKFANSPQIIHTYINGNSGYRLWSDNYCEQWGVLDFGSDNTTPHGFCISLLLEFKDINYYPTLEYMGNSNGSGYGAYTAIALNSKTTKTFNGYIWKTETSNRYMGWKASGFIKEINL